MTTTTINFKPGVMLPVGTRFCDSLYYDEATDRVVEGFQVFRQVDPEGEPTGRDSFVDNAGALCGVSIAKIKRQMALTDSRNAEAMADLLERFVLNDRQMDAVYGSSMQKSNLHREAVAVLQLVRGIKS